MDATTDLPPLDSGLLDVSGLSLAELDGLPGNVLSAMLQRVLEESLHPLGEPVAAFSSALAALPAKRPDDAFATPSR